MLDRQGTAATANGTPSSVRMLVPYRRQGTIPLGVVMRARVRCALALLALTIASARAQDTALPLLRLDRDHVLVTVDLVRGSGRAAMLVGRFHPEQQGYHLYDLALPHASDDAEGMPTRIDLPPGGPLTATGPETADQVPQVHDGLSVYPPGDVVLRLPVLLPVRADGAAVPTQLVLSYMSCSESLCNQPLIRQAVAVTIPSVRREPGPETAPGGPTSASAILPTPATAASGAPASVDTAALAAIVHRAVTQALAESSASVRWERPADVAAVGAALDQARAAHQAALLDFTGPSCVNCQKMEKSVFRQTSVRRALRALRLLQVNTDPPHEDLATWEQTRFQTENRPLYVRIAADGSERRWSAVFSPDDHATMTRFLAFLDGSGGGEEGGAGSGAGFWLLAVLGGLITLVMPCTYPMIPFTVNVFAKQAQGGARLLPLALFYAAGIVACFVGLGVLITGVLGAQLSTLAGHPLTNLVIAAVFVVFGLSLLGVFLLQLPPSWQTALGGRRGGYLGALIMGLTFAITAFSCTAPFAGSVLAEAVTTGSWRRAVEGMAVYGGTIAVPFFFIALSPAALARLPRAGAWMNEFKVVGGVVELAAALKFLAICDLAWGWGVIGRTTCLSVWSACALWVAGYLLGCWRFAGDSPVEHVGAGRTLLAIGFLALGLVLLAGLCGHDLGTVEAFFPGDPTPG